MSDLAPPQYPAPPPEPSAPHERRGLAIAALVLGVLALLGSWVPVLNVVSIALALAGLGVGVPALVAAARGTRGGRPLALAGVAASALALVVAILANILFGAAFTRLVADTLGSPDPAPSVTAAPAPVEPSETTPEPSSSEPSPEPSEPAAPAPAGALALGETAEVGDFTVAVTGVDPNGGEVVAAANEYADPPVGQFVLVDLTVTYEGSTEGTTSDISTEYQGTDARNYSTAGGCTAFLPNSGYRQPSLRPGGTASYSICFDLPPEAVTGGAVAVSSFTDYDAAPVVWSTQ